MFSASNWSHPTTQLLAAGAGSLDAPLVRPADDGVEVDSSSWAIIGFTNYLRVAFFTRCCYRAFVSHVFRILRQIGYRLLFGVGCMHSFFVYFGVCKSVLCPKID